MIEAYHFLVSMPELIAQTNMDQQSINRLRAELSLLTQWMSVESNALKYVTSDYENTTQDYKDKLSTS
jgi:mortality factor 4-like protein 1